MILKITVRDNDYTSIIESYLNNFKISNFRIYVKSIEDPREFRDRNVEAEDLLQKVIYESDKLTEEEKKRFIEIVKEGLLYIVRGTKSTQAYFKKNLEVELTDTIKDEWHNGEVVYLFITQDKIITM